MAEKPACRCGTSMILTEASLSGEMSCRKDASVFYQTKCCINRLKCCLPLLHQSPCSVCQTANWTAFCASCSIRSVLMSFNCCLEDKLRLPRKKCSLLYFTHAIQWVLCCSCKASCKCESVLMTKWHFNESNGISHTYCVSISHMDLAPV